MIKINEFTDITYSVESNIVVITINRPERYNALRGRTVDELLAAFKYAWVDKKVCAVILTGAGEKAFCTGGDQKERAEDDDDLLERILTFRGEFFASDCFGARRDCF